MVKIALPLASAAAFMMLVAAGPSRAEFSIDEVTSLSGNYLAGRSAGKERDNEIAADYLAKALIEDPDNPVLIEKLFLLEVSSGNMPDAEELATKVLSFNSQHRMARIVLGLRDFRVRHYADARRNFAEASYTPVGELTSALLRPGLLPAKAASTMRWQRSTSSMAMIHSPTSSPITAP